MTERLVRTFVGKPIERYTLVDGERRLVQVRDCYLRLSEWPGEDFGKPIVQIGPGYISYYVHTLKEKLVEGDFCIDACGRNFGFSDCKYSVYVDYAELMRIIEELTP